MRTFVIAEAGSCHGQDHRVAVEMIRVAKAAGADAVKFQFWGDAGRLADRRRAKALLPVYERYQMPVTWLSSLRKECDGQGIEFMCSTYLSEDIQAVAPYVQRFKVASFEALDTELIFRHLSCERPVIVSLGMLGSQDLPALLARRRDYPDLKYLHCVSGYPTPLSEVNLSVIRHYDLDGFSDHTADAYMGADAVLAGARIVEVHFRAETTPPNNPDFRHSLPPHGLYRYVANIRAAEIRLGQPVKCVQPSERESLNYQVFSS